MKRPEFSPLQAQELATAFAAEGVEYLLLGKGAAILLGYPGTTQDVDVFPARTPENGQRMIKALRKLGFDLSTALEKEIVEGKDFVQVKNGPFDVDLVFVPDGIPSFAEAKSRMVRLDIFPIANLRDIIASKRASNRPKDRIDLDLMESFRQEYEKRNAPTLRSASEIAREGEKH